MSPPMNEPTTPAISARPQSTPFADLPTMSCAAAPMSIPNKMMPRRSMLRAYDPIAKSSRTAHLLLLTRLGLLSAAVLAECFAHLVRGGHGPSRLTSPEVAWWVYGRDTPPTTSGAACPGRHHPAEFQDDVGWSLV
jgi:hypothetical protein